MVSFPQKDWKNDIAGGTPLDEAGLDDLETRIANTFALVGTGGGGGGTSGAVESPVSVSGALVVGSHNPVNAVAAVTMTLPTGQVEGAELSVEKTDTSANVVTVSGSIRGTGGQTATLDRYGDTVLFRADPTGSWWPIAGRRLPSQIDEQIRSVVLADIGTEDSALNAAIDQRYLTQAEGADLFLSHPAESIKTANQSVTSSTTFVDDAHLTVPVAASTVYRLRGVLFYEADSASDLKCKLSLPSGATAKWRVAGLSSLASSSPASGNFAMSTESGVQVIGGGGAGSALAATIEGIVTTGSTAGNLTLQWAQNTSGATATTMYADSTLSVTARQAAIPAQPSDPGTGTGDPIPTLTSIPNASKPTIGGISWTAQSPDKAYSLGYVAGPPTYVKMELRNGDRWINDVQQFPNDARQRCMIRDNAYQPFGVDVWFAGSFRLNTSGWRITSDAYNEVMCWYHNVDSGESGSYKKAELQVAIRPDSAGVPWLQISTSGDPTGAAVSTDATTTTVQRTNINFTPYVGQWVNVVARTKFGKGVPGEAQFWLNGTQLWNATNIAIGYNDPQGPYLKAGMYRTGSPYTVTVEWANIERGTSSLLSRVASPLAVPTYAKPTLIEA